MSVFDDLADDLVAKQKAIENLVDALKVAVKAGVISSGDRPGDVQQLDTAAIDALEIKILTTRSDLESALERITELEDNPAQASSDDPPPIDKEKERLEEERRKASIKRDSDQWQKCPGCEVKKTDFRNPQAFGAHKRHCKGNQPSAESAIPKKKTPTPQPKPNGKAALAQEIQIEVSGSVRCGHCQKLATMIRALEDDVWTCPECQEETPGAQANVLRMRPGSLNEARLLGLIGPVTAA